MRFQVLGDLFREFPEVVEFVFVEEYIVNKFEEFGVIYLFFLLFVQISC